MGGRVWTVLAVSALLLVPAASASAAVRASDSTPTCSFNVGDTISRGGVGAVVPARGNGVGANADGPTNSSSSLDITVTPNGVVSINAATDGVDAPPQICVLARSKTRVILFVSLFLAAVGVGAGLVLVRAQRRAGSLVSPEGNG
jgi:hypothetical protein